MQSNQPVEPHLRHRVSLACLAVHGQRQVRLVQKIVFEGKFLSRDEIRDIRQIDRSELLEAVYYLVHFSRRCRIKVFRTAVRFGGRRSAPVISSSGSK